MSFINDNFMLKNETAKKLYASFGFVEQPQYFKDKPGEEMPAILEL